MAAVIIEIIIRAISLEVNLPTTWTDGQAQVGRVREQKRRRETIKEEKGSEERRYRCMKR
jgi:hypothetical protein